MRVLMPALALVAALAATSSAAAASPGHGNGATVDILAASYGSPRIDVLAGDTVTWRNMSVRVHTVAASLGDWASPRLALHGGFSHRFDALHYEAPGTDLTIGLLPAARWQAARFQTVDGVEHMQIGRAHV
jgi:plastocyanin